MKAHRSSRSGGRQRGGHAIRGREFLESASGARQAVLSRDGSRPVHERTLRAWKSDQKVAEAVVGAYRDTPHVFQPLGRLPGCALCAERLGAIGDDGRAIHISGVRPGPTASGGTISRGHDTRRNHAEIRPVRLHRRGGAWVTECGRWQASRKDHRTFLLVDRRNQSGHEFRQLKDVREFIAHVELGDRMAALDRRG